MPDSTLAGVITAIASVLTAAGLLVASITVLIPVLRVSKANHTEIREVHAIVNQHSTDSARYQVALVNTLKDAGIDVPPDQSLNVAPTPTDRALARINAEEATAAAATQASGVTP